MSLPRFCRSRTIPQYETGEEDAAGGVQSQVPAPGRSGHPWGASRVRSLPRGGVGTPGGIQSQAPAPGRSGHPWGHPESGPCPGEERAPLGGVQSQDPALWRRVHPGNICPHGVCARRFYQPSPRQPAGSSPHGQAVPGKGVEDSCPSIPSAGLGVSHGGLGVASQPTSRKTRPSLGRWGSGSSLPAPLSGSSGFPWWLRQ